MDKITVKTSDKITGKIMEKITGKTINKKITGKIKAKPVEKNADQIVDKITDRNTDKNADITNQSCSIDETDSEHFWAFAGSTQRSSYSYASSHNIYTLFILSNYMF